MPPIPPWLRRDRRATGRVADVVMVAFHQGPLGPDLPLSASRFGAPSAAAVSAVDVTAIHDPSWISGWRAGGIRAIAERELGADLAALDAADHCHLLRATIADPADLTYLQGAWALARWLVARGASVVLDAHPIRFHTARTIEAQAVDAPFDAGRELTVVFETEPAGARLGHVVHTRGLIKVARPDLVALEAPERAREMAVVLHAIAEAMADGFMPTAGGAAPKHDALQAAVRLSPLPPEDGLAEALHLNNDAWLVELDRSAS